MSFRNITSFALLTLLVALIGCESTPNAPDNRSAGAVEPAEQSVPARPARPIKGFFPAIQFNWFVSHFAEQGCGGGLVAGAQLEATGQVTNFGRTHAIASAAWDWAVPAAGVYTATGPATGTSATILSVYPHEFCSADLTATGEVVLTLVNGDQVFGVVSGGEAYELAFNIPGDGQEQFIEVDITSGSGRFGDASGFFVAHAIVDLAAGEPRLLEILPGGWIRYTPARRGHGDVHR